ncbi:hypothetical protein ACDX78_00865 [Virgibacillus oceani]
MEEISSYKIKLTKKLETADIINIHELALKSNFTIYVYREDTIADATNLANLISFFSFSSKNRSLVMIIDGQYAENGYHKVKSLLKNTIKGEWRVTHKIQNDISVAI